MVPEILISKDDIESNYLFFLYVTDFCLQDKTKPFQMCQFQDDNYLDQTSIFSTTLYSRYSNHVYSDYSDIVATFPGTKYIYSIIFRSDIVANRI